MPKVPRPVLIEYFGKGDKPTGPQFTNMLDSMVNFVDDRDLIGLREYNPDYDYLPGDCAVFNDQVVKCIIATTGPFNPADWSVLAAFGSVNYAGTWDTQNNVPPLQSSVGSKGFYYVVINASPDPNNNTTLNGINDWGTSDWAIFNGSVWEKVDNTESPIFAQNVIFQPTTSIASTNVQAAIEEVYSDLDAAVNTKVNRSGDTMTGDLILNADPTAGLGAATKNYVDSGDANVQTQVNTKVNRAGDTMTGDLLLNADPTLALGAATKQYVDATDTSLQSQINGKVSKAGDTMTGNLILNADPTIALGAATKQYVDTADASLQTQVNSKVSKAGDTMTGALVLSGDPVNALDATTKQYTDAGLNAKVDVTGDTMLGSLILNADPTAALGAATKQYADNADASLQTQVNAKVNRSGDTMTGDLILNADPIAALGAATKQYTDAGLSTKLNLAGGTMTGNLILNGDPISALGAATKQYVDSGDASLQTQVNAKVNRSGDTMTGDLILNADPTVALGAVTKQYVDAINTALSNSKVNKSGDTMTGLLTLSGDPTSALHASTKQYVDSNITAFAKKVVLSFPFGTDYATTSADFVRIPLQVVIPDSADVFPGTTLISARLYIDYLTENGSTTNAAGEAAISEWTGASSGIPTPVAGSTTTLADSNQNWVKVLSPSFTIADSTTYQVIFRRTQGAGGNPRVIIEAVSLILIYS